MATKYKPFFIAPMRDSSGHVKDVKHNDTSVVSKTISNIRQMVLEGTKSEMDPVYFAKSRMGIDLESNQVELVRAVCNWSIRNVASMQARQVGKSFSVAMGITICADRDVARRKDRGTLIGVFANKEDQAGLVRDKIMPVLKANSYFANRIDWKRTTQGAIMWRPRYDGRDGSIIKFLSASEQAHTEGETFDIIFIDESQKISDHVYEEVITPMGSSTSAKMIQTGTPRRKNHFYNVMDGSGSQYFRVKHDWTECPRLWRTGAVYINDRPYSSYVLSKMPLSLKRECFPENPIIDCKDNSGKNKTIHLWDLLPDDGKGMSVVNFKTQYMLQWLGGIDTFLTKQEWERMGNGMFPLLERGVKGEVYYAGIDCTGNLRRDDDDDDEDGSESHTSISVVRMAPDGRAHKVFQEFLPLDMTWVDQGKRFIELFDPINGKFSTVQKIFVDRGNVGMPVIDYGVAAGLRMEGISFNEKEVKSHKNFKNAMYDKFQFSVQKGDFLYPSAIIVKGDDGRLAYDNKDKSLQDMREAYDQWEDIEADIPSTSSVNKVFSQGNSKLGDDGPNSDVLAYFASFGKKVAPKVKPIIGRGRR